MATKKSTLLYIQIPSDLWQHRDTRKLVRLFGKKYPDYGIIAPLVVIALYMYFARNRSGYYAIYDEDLLDDLSNDIGIDSEAIQDAISLSASIGIIDETLFKTNILTSYDYQLMYQEVMKKLRRDFSFVGKPYVVIETDENQDPPKIKIDSSEENTDFSEESADSSEESTDFSEKCPRNVMYSNIKYSKVGESARARATPLVFDFEPLNMEWQKLLRQPLWLKKTPEALEIAYTTLNQYSPFVAIEVIRHTILVGIRELDPPTEAMNQNAKEAYRKYVREQEIKKHEQRMDDPQKFPFFTFSGENPSPRVVTIRNSLAAILQNFPEKSAEILENINICADANTLTIYAPEILADWLNQNDLKDLNECGLSIYIISNDAKP